MAKSTPFLLLLTALLVAATHAFVQPTASALSRVSNHRTVSSQLAMSTTTKPEIEVVSNPDKEFLEKKG
jgi:hypothetical protein